MKTTLAWFGLLFLQIALWTIALVPLNVYIIRDISDLFSITYIQNLDIVAIYGSILLLSLVQYKYTEQKEELNFEEELADYFKRIIIKTLYTLTAWAAAYLLYWIHF